MPGLLPAEAENGRKRPSFQRKENAARGTYCCFQSVLETSIGAHETGHQRETFRAFLPFKSLEIRSFRRIALRSWQATLCDAAGAASRPHGAIPTVANRRLIRIIP